MRQKPPQLSASEQALIKKRIDRGIRRKWWLRKGSSAKRFLYLDPLGQWVTDEDSLKHIKSLVIPPAWKFVRISPSPSSKVQAVGMDTSGRMQYLYHSKFSEKQQRKKFAKIERFGEFLPQLRKITNEHISLEGFPREKVLAVMIRLINSLYIRVGTDLSVRRYKTFGITTLQNRHLKIGSKGELIFEFVGKSSVKHRKVIVDQELAAVMSELKNLGTSRRLFHYHDEAGSARSIRPEEVNQYLKSITSPEYSSNDFRTWGATLLAAVKLAELGKAEDERKLKTNVNNAVRKVAERLGNTPAVCRSSYIHPTILKAYTDGIILDEFSPRNTRKSKRIEVEYEPEELSLLELFRAYRNGQ